jgi:23S rRNA (uridine2552-2'-O)-methyltransferase
MKKYRDHYFKKAKQESYPARSVYKLQDIDKRFQLLKPGLKVLDLGAAPGSWSQYAAKKVGPSGKILAVDLKPLDVQFPEQVTFLEDDLQEPSANLKAKLQEMGPFDLVLSDMAPKTIGVKISDQARSFELAEIAVQTAASQLRSNGHVLVKVFEGPDVPELIKEMRSLFKKAKTVKPKSSRAESKEIFLLGLNKKSE